MSFLSFNVHGIGGASKARTLINFLKSTSLDCFLIQETMCLATHAIEFFTKHWLGWYFCAMDSVGLSGGLLSGWNPATMCCTAYKTMGGILLKGIFLASNLNMEILNMYALYRDRETYWKALAATSILNFLNFIVAGDLNLTLLAADIWGSYALVDELASFFKELFQSAHMVDILPIKLGATWSNNWSGEGSISKRLDRFLMPEYLVANMSRYRTWIEHSTFSDHHA